MCCLFTKAAMFMRPGSRKTARERERGVKAKHVLSFTSVEPSSPKSWVLPPLINSWTIIILNLYRALDITPGMGC